LPLCGTKDRFPCCHDAFDTNQLCFIAVPDSETAASSSEVDVCARATVAHAATLAVHDRKWLVLVREWYADYTPDGRGFPRIVTLPNDPSRTGLHNRAKVFMSLVDEANVADLTEQAKIVLSPATPFVQAWLREAIPLEAVAETPLLIPCGQSIPCCNHGCCNNATVRERATNSPYCDACFDKLVRKNKFVGNRRKRNRRRR
jgi:hypothetical protein